MSAIFVVVIVAQIRVTSLFLLFPGRAGVRRTFLSFAECCSWAMFFPLGLQERIDTHATHYRIWPMRSCNLRHIHVKPGHQEHHLHFYKYFGGFQGFKIKYRDNQISWSTFWIHISILRSDNHVIMWETCPKWLNYNVNHSLWWCIMYHNDALYIKHVHCINWPIIQEYMLVKSYFVNIRSMEYENVL